MTPSKMLKPLPLLPFIVALLAGRCAAELPTIEWDPATLRLVAEGGDYGRIARLPDQRLAAVYDRRGTMYLRHSGEEGNTWDDPIPVARADDAWLTNADLLVLRSGHLLYFWNERPSLAVRWQGKRAPEGTLTRPFKIQMSRSTDLGQTWSPPQTLYTAGVTFEDGCWEPAAVELPTGQIHVYFANEAPYPHSDEQEISLLRSDDAGKTWSAAERVSMRAKHRDGMPAPLVLADGKGIVVAIEDNGLTPGNRFKPALLRTPLADNWRTTAPIPGDSPSRESALETPLPPPVYAGAPFLRQLPSGETLLSFQESDDGSLARCRMAVYVGTPDARRFTHKSYPLPLGPKGNQAWNSLFIKNPNTVTAVLGATVDDKRGIWSIDGHLLRPPPTSNSASPHAPKASPTPVTRPGH